jgi:hypothetical protein
MSTSTQQPVPPASTTDVNGNSISVGTEVLVAGTITAIGSEGAVVDFTPHEGSGTLVLPNTQVLERAKVVIEAPEDVEGAGGTGLVIEKPE